MVFRTFSKTPIDAVNEIIRQAGIDDHDLPFVSEFASLIYGVFAGSVLDYGRFALSDFPRITDLDLLIKVRDFYSFDKKQLDEASYFSGLHNSNSKKYATFDEAVKWIKANVEKRKNGLLRIDFERMLKEVPKVAAFLDSTINTFNKTGVVRVETLVAALIVSISNSDRCYLGNIHFWLNSIVSKAKRENLCEWVSYNLRCEMAERLIEMPSIILDHDKFVVVKPYLMILDNCHIFEGECPKHFGFLVNLAKVCNFDVFFGLGAYGQCRNNLGVCKSGGSYYRSPYIFYNGFEHDFSTLVVKSNSSGDDVVSDVYYNQPSRNKLDYPECKVDPLQIADKHQVCLSKCTDVILKYAKDLKAKVHEIVPYAEWAKGNSDYDQLVCPALTPERKYCGAFDFDIDYSSETSSSIQEKVDSVKNSKKYQEFKNGNK